MEFTKEESKELTETERMSFGEKLYALRKKNGLSQQAVAEALQVSRQAVSRWELGTSVPTMENLVALSKVYEVSVDNLLNSESKKSYQQDTSEKETATPTFQREKRCIKRYVCMIALALVLLFITTVALIYKEVRYENSGHQNFSEVESEVWENDNDIEKFILDW